MIKFLHNGINGFFEPCAPENLDGINNNFFAIDILMQGRVIDFIDELPESYSISDSYIVSADFTASGIDYEKNDVIAWNGVRWVNFGSELAWQFYVESLMSNYFFDGTDWVVKQTVGGNGSSPQWFSVAGGALLETDSFGIKNWVFSPSDPLNPSLNNSIRLILKRDLDHPASSSRKYLRFSFNSDGGSNFVGWTVISRLIKPGMALTDNTYEHTETIETEVASANGIVNVQIPFSDAAGNIGDEPFEPENIVVLDLIRSTPTNTEDIYNSKLIDGTTALITG